MAPGRVSFSDQVRAHARSLGFDAVAITRAGPGAALDRDFPRYQAFVAAGMHGQMHWLAEHAAARERLDGEEMLPGARSIVCVARRYPRDADNGEVSRAIARYARGHDYHRFLRRRVRRLATYLRSLGTAERPVEARPMIDEKPILERAWAARAGLGFVGKNGMLIVPGLGSFVMLAEVVTTLDLVDEDPPIAERCGSCTRCLDVCPTRAFPEPFVLDARRCVSYLTIEHEGPIDAELREGVGQNLFGCDDCQTVCPFNAGMGARAPAPGNDGDPFAPLERWSTMRLTDFLALDDAGADAATEGSPLRRAGKVRLARNAALVLGHRGDPASLGALERAANEHEEAVVREAARWAVERIGRVTSKGAP